MGLFFLPQLFEAVPQGRKALITFPNGRRETVEGPKKVFVGFGTTVELFEHLIVPEREAYAITDEFGMVSMVEGPAVVHIHPDGQQKELVAISLSPQEAVVVRQTSGERIIYVGMGYPVQAADQQPQIVQTALVQLQPGEHLHQFKWTGSKGDTEEKSPGSLRITQLRLQETQTWFQVLARTADNIAIQFNLMVFFGYTDVRLLLVNDDPLGVMYNRITAALLKAVGNMKFDEFRKKPSKVVEAAARFAESEEDRKGLTEMGLEVSNAILRQWKPLDASVERLMAQEGTTIAQQAVAEAEHKARLAAIEAETAELLAAQNNTKLKEQAATAEGTQQAARLIALYAALEGNLGKDGAQRVVALSTLTDAAKGGRLTVTSEMLGMGA